MSCPTSPSRRDFLKKSATVSGFALGVTLMPGIHPVSAEQTATESLSPNVFVELDADGQLHVTCHRSEMGQQIRTAIAQIIADELDADWQRVTVIQANGHPKYGDQNTDGSRSVRRNLERLRTAGATAALLLREAAAQGWQVDVSECENDNHTVHHIPSGRRADYKTLVGVAATLPIPQSDAVTLKPRSKWKFIGKVMTSVDIDDVVSGNTTFGQDVQLDNMLVAVIQRPPVMFTQPVSVDDTATRKVAGVVDVITLPKATPPAAFNPLGGVAVLAKNTWAAMQGVKALNVSWSDNAHSSYSSEQFKQTLIDTARKDGEVVRKRGDALTELENADQVIEATYYAPLLSQAPMEPPAATAHVTADSAEIWACTQTPQSTRQNVAAALKMPEEQVTVHVTLLGGGFGRKSKPDFSVEAALLAKQAGQPVKVIWRREDDIQHGYFHTVSAQHLRAVQDEAGTTTAWRHNTVFPTISSTFNASANSPSNGELRLGFIDNPFDIANMQLEKGQAENHVRIGWLRSVANVYHAFAMHAFADELAHAAKQDSRDYLLSLIGKDRHIDLAAEGAEYDNYGDPIDVYPIDTARLKNVIRRVTDLADWDQRHQQKRFLGLAAHRSFLSYAAAVVEVVVEDDGSWSIPNAYMSLDAGTVVNPGHVEAQCEGGMIYGLSCAIGQITADNGQINQSNFHNYQVARINHAPQNIHVDIVESTTPPGGVGEPPTPPFAPALANALFAATGKRIRELPIPLSLS
ncbi:molybdopterin-dependent oxidoreductase [Alteromonas sp. ASW11-19]|uniref:Molybdopterin-dependent oxidoreductase n=1 Tax=Alteromonas salexigens TaxID=2982530 RepID=A0ABT2VRA6_9ALTE|nr:molybdopterin cofactor-binding domain-containing protein [Alteromonas salexigens]MCU7555831.1 molybdopterin-dependent oxidoreductase [Alteromonas salexigens]